MDNTQLLDKYEIKVSTSKQSNYSDNALGFYHKIRPKLKKLTVLSGGINPGSWIFGISKYMISPIQYVPNQTDSFVLINRIYSEHEYAFSKEYVLFMSDQNIYDHNNNVYNLNQNDYISVAIISDPVYALYNSYVFEIKNLPDLFSFIMLSSKSLSEYSSIIYPQNKIFVISKENIEKLNYILINLSESQKQIIPTQIYVNPFNTADSFLTTLDNLISDPISQNQTKYSAPFVISSNITEFSYVVDNNTNFSIECTLVNIFGEEYPANTSIINKTDYVFEFSELPLVSKNSNIVNTYLFKIKNNSSVPLSKEQLKDIQITINFR